MADNKILEKLRKLMNLKESASDIGNVGEANAAAAGIQRLLTQYNLSIKDIPEQEKIDNPIIMQDIPYFHQQCKGAWYETLVSIIAEHNMCEILVVRKSNNGRYKKTKLQIVGRKNNVEIVEYLISFLSNHFIAQGKKEYVLYHNRMLNNSLKPKSFVMYLRAFLSGCVIGYNDKIESLKKEFESDDLNEIILASNTELEKYLKDLHVIQDSNKCNLNIDKYATSRGITTGKEVEINKGVYADSVSEDLRLY